MRRHQSIRNYLVAEYDCLVSEGGCGAPKGRKCRTKDGGSKETQPHAARWNQHYDRRVKSSPKPARTELQPLHRIERTSAQTVPVKFLMAGMERPPGMGVRLYASRNWRQGLQFGQASADFKTYWHVEGDCDNMLIVDGEDWNDALRKLFTRWGNEDAGDRAIEGGQRAIGWPGW